MTRTAYVCPRCGTRLGWKRRGGSYALSPGVVAGKARGSPDVGLLCPVCSLVSQVPAMVIRLEPSGRFVDKPLCRTDTAAPDTT